MYKMERSWSNLAGQAASVEGNELLKVLVETLHLDRRTKVEVAGGKICGMSVASSRERYRWILVRRG